MEEIPLSWLAASLVVLLLLSAFFSLSETAMMASNRFRLRHLAQSGHRGAELAINLLDKTDKLLGVILLGNNLINSAAATLVSLITIALFGEDKIALGLGTLAVTFAILVFAEITPKIIGASHADQLAMLLGYVLNPLLRLFYPLVWFINLFASALLRLLRLSPGKDAANPKLSMEELRSLVLESSHLVQKKHHTILSSLLELNNITVEDVMTPRGQIEILDLDTPKTYVMDQLSTSHHSRLPVCRGSLDQLVGVLTVRRLLGHVNDEDFSEALVLEAAAQPYFIPAGTPVFSQLAYFQENRQRIGFIVNEYGDILGLLTLEDIIEEFVGDFTTSIPDYAHQLAWDDTGSALVEGTRSLREINRELDLNFPLDGPKTLNGLILEHLQDIPEAGLSLKISNIPVEILQTRERSITTLRIFQPVSADSA